MSLACYQLHYPAMWSPGLAFDIANDANAQVSAVGNVGVEPTSVLLPKQAAHPEPCFRSCRQEAWGSTG